MDAPELTGPGGQTISRLHHLLDHWTDVAPDRLACIDHDGTRLTFAQFADAVDDAVGVLQKAAVRPGDRVLIAAENSVALVAFVLACSRLDAWALLVNARVTARELAGLEDHARPRAAVFTTACSDDAATHARSRKATTRSTGAFGEVTVTTRDDTSSEACHESARQQVAALIYTSGTTGNPKGVMLTHANLLYISWASGHARGLRADDHYYVALPVTHIFGFASIFLGSLRAGAVMEYVTRFDPQAAFAAFADRTTAFPGVPAMYARLMEYARANDIGPVSAPHLRYMSSGGAPLDPDWKRRVEACLGVTLHNGYGLTEAAPTIAVTRFGDSYDIINVGRPLPNQDVRLAPAPGRDGLVDGVGEILVRGPNVMKGYYRNPEATAEALDADGFLHTGDLGRFNDDGTLSVVGRCKELIIRSGFNVYPPDVEAAINDHPAVVQSAVVGRTCPDGNEEVLAFVESPAGSGLDESQLREHLASRLAPYKRPARIVIAEKLPAASTGKLLKHLMIETFADLL